MESLDLSTLSDRDLDALVVEHVYGWVYIKVGSDYDGKNAGKILFWPDRTPTQDYYNQLPLRGKVHKGWFAPNYSTDWYFALQLCRTLALPTPARDLPVSPRGIVELVLAHLSSIDPTFTLKIQFSLCQAHNSQK